MNQEIHKEDQIQSNKEEPEWVLKTAEKGRFGILRGVYFLGDKWISSCGEFVKSCSQEMCHLGYQMINGACAFAIGLLEEPGYESKRSHRIKKTRASVTIQDIQKEKKQYPSKYSYKNYFPRKNKKSKNSKHKSQKEKQLHNLSTIPNSPFGTLQTPEGEIGSTEIHKSMSTETIETVNSSSSLAEQSIQLDTKPIQIELPSEKKISSNEHSNIGFKLRAFLITLLLLLKRYFLIFLNYAIEWIRLMTRTFLCFITFFMPNYNVILRRKNEDQNEALHLSLMPGEIELSADDIPGLVEDLQLKSFQTIDNITLSFRQLWSYACNPYNYITAYKVVKKWIKSPTKLRDLRRYLHIRSFSSILKGYLFDLDAYTAPTLLDVNRKEQPKSKKSHALARGLLGFPLEEYTVHTIDGYCIILFRIPNKETKKIVYLQHGVMDTAFAWISNTSNDSLATICYEQGYDVFFGSFRGTDGHYQSERIKHETLLENNPEYWRYTIDDLVLDWEAFIHAILVIKEREKNTNELNDTPVSGTKYCGDVYVSEYRALNEFDLLNQKYNITAIAHSMGGMTLEQYIINSRIVNHPHFISKCILLSPAGYHRSIAFYLRLPLYILNYTIPKDKSPTSFPVKNSVVHLLAAKILQDLQRTPATLEVLNYIASSLIGGQSHEWPFQRVNYTKYPLGVCSFHILLQGIDLILNDKYTMYDFGKEGNQLRYHSDVPINYADCFRLIDIPMHYIGGKYDTLVPPKDIQRHVEYIQQAHPELATFKVFDTAGHLQFTIGLHHDYIDYIVSLLNEDSPVIPFTRTDTELSLGYTKCDPEGHPYK